MIRNQLSLIIVTALSFSSTFFLYPIRSLHALYSVTTSQTFPQIPENAPIVFESKHQGVSELYKLTTTGVVRLTDNPWEDTQPSWSPNRDKIVFVSNETGSLQIYTMNADGSQRQRLTNNPTSVWNPVYSPDGTKIAFTLKRNATSLNPGVFVMNADGSNQRQLSSHNDEEKEPFWFPDGNKIAFVSTRDYYDHIYVMNADGSDPKARANDPGVYFNNPAVSPNGTKIAYSRVHSEAIPKSKGDLWVMEANGQNKVRLTSTTLIDENSPTWSPDNTQIAFMSDQDGDWDLFVMNVDGSNIQKLFRTHSYTSKPAWAAPKQAYLTLLPVLFTTNVNR